jgi:hypothetical protein
VAPALFPVSRLLPQRRSKRKRHPRRSSLSPGFPRVASHGSLSSERPSLSSERPSTLRHRLAGASALKTGLRESRAAVARQVLVVSALFRVTNCCCRGRKGDCFYRPLGSWARPRLPPWANGLPLLCSDCMNSGGSRIAPSRSSIAGRRAAPSAMPKPSLSGSM